MKRHLPKAMIIALVLAYWPSVALSAADPVKLDCDPTKNCKPIDPCAIAPERCKPAPSTPTKPPPKP